MNHAAKSTSEYSVFSEPEGLLPVEFLAALKQIRARPDMYFVGGANVGSLEAFLYGYELGARQQGSTLSLGLGTPFSRWLCEAKMMRGAANVAWSAILRANFPTEQTAFDGFFELFAEFRRNSEKKAAEPGATDNPDDAQRLREDH